MSKSPIIFALYIHLTQAYIPNAFYAATALPCLVRCVPTTCIDAAGGGQDSGMIYSSTTPGVNHCTLTLMPDLLFGEGPWHMLLYD